MRVPRLALSTLALGIGLVGAAALVATPATPAAAHTSTPSPAPGMNMPGMDMNMRGMDHGAIAGAAPAAAPKQDRSAGIERSRLKPVFLEAHLDGRQEVPVPGKPPVGDPKGSATGLIRVQGNRVTFAFSWKGISAPTLGHIHQGVAGTNGDVKVPLFATAMPDNITAAAGVLTVSDPAIADALRANPTGLYLNLHTKELPGGAGRGQLTKVHPPPELLAPLRNGAAAKAVPTR